MFHPPGNGNITRGTGKTEKLSLWLLPSVIWIYLHAARVAPILTQSWLPGVVRELAEDTLCTVLTAAHPFVCSNWLGNISVSIAGSRRGKKVINRNHCQHQTDQYWEGAMRAGKIKVWKKINLVLGREVAGDGGWNVRVQVSKAPSLSLVSKPGNRLNKRTARISRKDIYLQYQQLPSFSLAHS